MLKRAFLLLLVCLLLPWAAFAEDAEPQWLTVPISTPVSKTLLHWAFPYSDALFDAPATTYGHTLAQSSLGLAVAAFRQKNVPLSQKDEAVRAFLTEAGFGALCSEEYDVPPTIDTIATMIGSKRIGDTTLVAVAVSGGDYEKEWQSNFTISAMRYNDDEAFHDGFANAAEQVVQRVTEYLQAQAITGPVKIWLAGYSRAAAVSNIAAFALLESGAVADSDLYAYTFATPRCVTGRLNRACPSVFNIVGSFDPVPAVPFPEWGYDRFGTTLFLPAQELCADYAARKAAVEPIYERLTGVRYWNNPQGNWLCCKVMQTLDEVMRKAGDYQSMLQQFAVEALSQTGPDKLWKIALLASRDSSLRRLLTSAAGNTDALYSTVAYSLYRQRTGREENLWNHGVSLTAELMHEHCPDVYVAWMFSQEEPERLFIRSLDYHQLILAGDVAVSATDADGNALSGLAAFPLGEAQLVSLPAETACTVTLTARTDTTVQLLETERTAQHLYGRVLVWGPMEGVPLAAGATLRLTLPQGAGADVAAFTVDGGFQLAIDTRAADLNGDFAVLDVNFSGDAARGFIGNALRFVAIAAALLLALLVLGIVWLCLRARRKRRARRLEEETSPAGEENHSVDKET